MILGNRCTRGCGFCSVPKGNPARHDMRARSRRARQRGAHGRRDEAALRGDHQRESRRSGGWRLAPLRRNRARGAARAAGGARGSADAGFLRRSGRRGARARCRRRTSSITTWRPCRACTARVRPQADYRQSLDVLALRARGMRRRADQVRLHGGAGRDRRGGARAAARSARRRHRRRHHRPVSAAHAPQSAGGRIHRAARSSTRIAITAFRSASRWSSAGRWCAVPTWRISRVEPSRGARRAPC